MKSILCSFVVGVILGGVAIYLFLNQYSVPRASMTITSSNPNATISEETLKVATRRKAVLITASFDTDQKGIFTNEITLNRQDLQYQHSLGFQVGYLITSKTPLLDLTYSYENLTVSAKVGYSFRLKELDYGFGIGGKVSF